MPLAAPTNCWPEVEAAIAAALPRCAAFQAFVRAADEAEAGPHVFLEELGQPPAGDRWTAEQLAEIDRYVVVASARENPFRLRRITADAFTPSGQVLLYFDARMAPGDEVESDDDETAATIRRVTDAEADRLVKNHVLSAIGQLIDLFGEEGGPYLTGVDVVSGPYHNHPDERPAAGHWVGCEVLLIWGVDAGN